MTPACLLTRNTAEMPLRQHTQTCAHLQQTCSGCSAFCPVSKANTNSLESYTHSTHHLARLRPLPWCLRSNALQLLRCAPKQLLQLGSVGIDAAGLGGQQVWLAAQDGMCCLSTPPAHTAAEKAGRFEVPWQVDHVKGLPLYLFYKKIFQGRTFQAPST